MRIVIIGNGVCGMEAALGVRAREPDADLCIVSEESDHFFSRTALMWVFSGQLSHRDIEPYERDVYTRLNIRRVRARVVRVDPKAHQLDLAGGLGTISYDRLLIASGSRPKRGSWPGSDLLGVGHFVTLQDLEWLEREVFGERVRERPVHADAHLSISAPDSPYLKRKDASTLRGKTADQCVVIGGGLIGMEAVEILHAAKKRVHFVMRDDWFWPMALNERESRFITQRMKAQGIEVHSGHDLTSMEGDERGLIRAVHTKQGTFKADLCVIAIGVTPNTSFLDGSGVERDANGGILVGKGLETNVPDVFAAGDCASVTWDDGSVRPEQLWYTARDQGRIAGRRLLGDEVHYHRGTFYNSAKLMDIEYTTVGFTSPRAQNAREWFFEEQGKVRSTLRIILSGERVVGMNLLGRRWDHSVLIRFIKERRSLSYVLDHLHEANFDTEFVPRLKVPKDVRNQTLTSLGG